MAAKRVGLKPVTRFEVFKRDGFVCQYCGGKPPAVVLEVDHINPVANGGENNIDNLLTACGECNRGKAARLLDVVPETMQKKAELLAEKRLQVVEYEKLLRRERRRAEKQIDRVSDAFSEKYAHKLTEAGRRSVQRFLTHIPAETLIQYVTLAASRIPNPSDGFKYFCGICWKAIKEGGK